MSTKGKAKYNRAIALSKLQKAQRLIAEVNARYDAQANRWEFANPAIPLLIGGLDRILSVAVVLEEQSQKAGAK